MSHRETEEHLTKLYRQSVENSGVNIVPGDQLGLHHKVSNYVADNPVKVLASLAVPSVAYIYYGNAQQAHLDTSVKLLHTRVFGQFATISLLLGVMGFTEFMNRNGKFITQVQADARVEEMRNVRKALMARLDYEKQIAADLKREIRNAHEEDVRDAKQRKKQAVSATS